MNLQDARARMLGQHHRAVQHSGHAQVVDELLLAERLLGAAQARDRMADAVRRVRARSRSRLTNAGIAASARTASPKYECRRGSVRAQLTAACRTPRRPSGSRRGFVRSRCSGRDVRRAPLRRQPDRRSCLARSAMPRGRRSRGCRSRTERRPRGRTHRPSSCGRPRAALRESRRRDPLSARACADRRARACRRS